MEDASKQVKSEHQDCYFCHVDMLIEREHMFHYIMGLAMYNRASYEQIKSLISCYSQIYNRPAESEFLSLVNEIEAVKNENLPRDQIEDCFCDTDSNIGQRKVDKLCRLK